jgi:hypothetical protein
LSRTSTAADVAKLELARVNPVTGVVSFYFPRIVLE